MTARSLKLLGALAVTLAAAGCIKVFPDPPPAPLIFPMRADPALPRSDNPAPVTLAVAAPTITSALSGPDLVAFRRDGSVAYVKGVRWTAPTTDMLRGLFVETLDRSNLVRAAVRGDGSARPDYTLQMDVATFALERERRSAEASFVGTARLVSNLGRQVVASRIVEVTRPAGMDGPAEGARALEAVARQAALETATWAAEEARKDQLARAASASK